MTGLRHVLLLVQGALTGLVAVEAVLLGLVEQSPVLLAVAVLTTAVAVLPVVLAFGLLRGRRRARGLTVIYELALLVSGYVNTLIGNDDLASLLVTLALPVVLLCLLARYSPEPSETAG